MKVPRFLCGALLWAPAALFAQSVIVDDGDSAFVSQLGAGVPILMYHGLSADTGAFYEPSFQPQMQYLKNNNFTTISMDDLVSWVTTGSPTLPTKPIVLTFDDDYITVYTTAYPVLKGLGFIGVNYAHTDFVGVPPGPTTSFDHADWTELQEMESEGVIFTESHTVTHPHLTLISDTQETNEIVNSKASIESNLTAKVCRHLAYPFGDYDTTTIAKVQSAGYLSAVTTQSGLVTRSTPLYQLNRYGVNPNASSNPVLTLSSTFLNAANAGQTGTWTFSSANPPFIGAGYRYAPAGTGTSVATWTFTPTQTGNWQVSARWTTSNNRADNSPFTINHQGGQTTVRVNQKLNNGVYQNLGIYYFVGGMPYTVTLSNDANGLVIADAVKFDFVSRVKDWQLFE